MDLWLFLRTRRKHADHGNADSILRGRIPESDAVEVHDSPPASPDICRCPSPIDMDVRAAVSSRNGWVHERLTGWGRTTYAESDVLRPSGPDDLMSALGSVRTTTLVARGNGRSYGDCGINDGGGVVCFSAMKRICSFDPASGETVVEPGVTFGQLLDVFGAQGWIPPVTPGTQFATIGGAIANDVHGKNHDRDGSFGDHLLWLDMLLPDGSVRHVTPESLPGLFAATIGGIGLTGFILRACFRMVRVPGQGVVLQERRMRDLDQYLEALAEARQASRYSVGWIDGLASGRSFGRGILETADYTDAPVPSARRSSWRMPDAIPSMAINRLTVRAFNELYYRRIPARGRRRYLDFRRFFYPLDAILDWNRIYGGAGFLQFQCVIPDEAASTGIRTLLTIISKAGGASFLAVVKTMGASGKGYLSFPARGITLALDFPMRGNVKRLMRSLHSIVADHGGRIYLAKDACLDASQMRAMYPRLDDLQQVRASVDPSRMLRSDMARRLGL